MLGFKRKNVSKAEAKLRKKLESYELSSFPSVVTNALKKLRNPDSTASTVGSAIAADPGLSIRILRTVNSAAYGQSRAVDSLDQAVAILGFAAIESLVLALAVNNAVPSTPVQGFEPSRFWIAAARRGTTARALASKLSPTRESESFTAALLQDMAIPILAHHTNETYGPLLEHWHQGNDDLAELERSEIGCTHADVATWLCEAWELPDGLSQALSHHHELDGDASVCPPAVALVSLLREEHQESGVDALVETAHSQFGIPADEGLQLVEASFLEADGLAAMFA